MFVNDPNVVYALRTGMAEIANIDVAKITATIGVAQFLGGRASHDHGNSGRRLAGAVVVEFELGMASVAETAASRVDLMTVDATRMGGVLNARLAGEGFMVSISGVTDIYVPPMDAHVDLEGSYCRDWESTGAEWCYVNAGVICGAVTVDAATGYYRSNGPCEAAVESRSRRVLDAATSVAQICWVAGATGVALMLAAAGALGDWLSLRSAPRAEGETELERRNRDPGLKERFREAKLEAKRKNAAGLVAEAARLELYGLAMQAISGPEGAARDRAAESETDLERRKRQAWSAHGAMACEDAMENYCDAVRKL